MAMQQLAAASPRAMGQRPELKFVNEQGEMNGGREQNGSMRCVCAHPQTKARREKCWHKY